MIISQALTLQSLLQVLNSTKATDIPNLIKALPSESHDTLMKYLYKGMAQGPPAGANSTQRNVTPPATGFSQIGGRNFGGAEGGGQAMSVLLSWHEKVSRKLEQL